MNRTFLASIAVFALSLAAVPVVWGDHDHSEQWQSLRRQSTGVALLTDPVYKNECGSCHMAYPPGLLPAASWEKIMSGLDDHFGDNAELNTEKHAQVARFLLANSADKSNYRRSRQFAYGLDASRAPVRITQTPFFKNEHDEIPASWVSGNKQVGSFSHCNACHSKAENASFKEREIKIPGHGRWDD